MRQSPVIFVNGKKQKKETPTDPAGVKPGTIWYPSIWAAGTAYLNLEYLGNNQYKMTFIKQSYYGGYDRTDYGLAYFAPTPYRVDNTMHYWPMPLDDFQPTLLSGRFTNPDQTFRIARNTQAISSIRHNPDNLNQNYRGSDKDFAIIEVGTLSPASEIYTWEVIYNG